MSNITYTNVADYLDARDLDNKIPSINMIISNRTAGKTVSTFKLCYDDFFKFGRRFVVLYRSKYELKGSGIAIKCALENFDECEKIVEIKDKPLVQGVIRKYILCIRKGDIGDESEINEEPEVDEYEIGYAVCLKDREAVKKYSGVFAKVYNVVMDEFQLESGKYIQDEIGCFKSALNSIARGGKKMSRFIRCILLSNDVSLLNPYFVYYGVHKRLKPGTKKLRGNGWVAHFIFNEDASRALQNAAHNAADKDTKYMRYSSGLGQLYACNSFIDKIPPKSRYLMTIYYKEASYGVREVNGGSLMHVSHKIDSKCRTVMTFEETEVEENRYMITRSSQIWKVLCDYYRRNAMRFDDLESKNMMFDLLGIAFTL